MVTISSLSILIKYTTLKCHPNGCFQATLLQCIIAPSITSSKQTIASFGCVKSIIIAIISMRRYYIGIFIIVIIIYTIQYISYQSAILLLCYFNFNTICTRYHVTVVGSV